MMLIWLLLLVISLALTLKYWRIKNVKLLAISQELPGPPTWPLVGNALMFVYEDIFMIFYKCLNKYGNNIRFWLGPDLNIIVSDPEDLKILLSSQKISEKGVQYKYMRTFVGDGMLAGSGPIWRKHRKLANPNFTKRAVEGLTELFNTEADYLLNRLQCLQGQEIDMYKYVVKTTTYIVCQSIMGISKEETLSVPRLQELVDSTPSMYHLIFERMTKWWLQIDPVYWMLDRYKLEKHFMKIRDIAIGNILRYRQDILRSAEKIDVAELMDEDVSSKNSKLSVIDRLILSNTMGDMELIKKSFTIFTASQEAAAKIASFLLLMLAYHPDCQERFYQEIIDVVGEEPCLVTEDHLRRMPYLEMVFKEVIRLFPIGVAIQRKVIEDIAISKTTIPAGCSLVIPIYHIQRDPRYWKNPDAFDPDRFTPENSKGRPACAFLPFSLGPMDCIGRHFGTKLVKTIAIKVVQKFKLSSNESYSDLKIIAAISVKAANGWKGIMTDRKSGKEPGRINKQNF